MQRLIRRSFRDEEVSMEYADGCMRTRRTRQNRWIPIRYNGSTTNVMFFVPIECHFWLHHWIAIANVLLHSSTWLMAWTVCSTVRRGTWTDASYGLDCQTMASMFSTETKTKWSVWLQTQQSNQAWHEGCLFCRNPVQFKNEIQLSRSRRSEPIISGGNPCEEKDSAFMQVLFISCHLRKARELIAQTRRAHFLEEWLECQIAQRDSMCASNGSRLATRTFEPCDGNECSDLIGASHAS
jgi:hypothetical protein